MEITDENQNNNQKKDWWFYLFIIFPTVTIYNFKDIFSDKMPEIALAGILGILGASVGFLAYFLTTDKNRNTKIVTFAILMVGIIGTGYYFGNKTTSDKKNLLSCSICGYFGLEKKGEECEVCLVEINESFMEYGDYNSLEELIKKEQFFFFLQNQNVELDWYNPKILEKRNHSYLKNENWKPVLTQEEIGNYQIKN